MRSSSTSSRRSPAPRKHTPPETLPLDITALAVGGEGIGRHDGRVVFVSNALPGDRVEVRLTEQKERFARGEVVQRRVDSPSRRVSPCEFSEKCGGCPWIALPEAEQRRHRETLVRDLMVRMAGLPGEVVQPVVASPRDLGYRNRLRLHAEGDRLGFRAPNARTLVDIPTCLVASQALNGLLTRVRAWLRPSLPLRGLLQVELQETDEGELLLAFSGTPVHQLPDLTPVRALARVLLDATPLQVKGQPRLPFAQANPGINQRLIQAAHEALAPQASDRILDLYAGSGNFSLGLQGRVRSIHGVEFSQEAVAEANRRAQANDGQARYTVADCETEVRRLLAEGQHFDGILLDPPRTGAAAVVPLLKALRPTRLVYVACDPATLARDLKLLTLAGFEVHTVTPYDMMPQTSHVECLAFLTSRP